MTENQQKLIDEIQSNLPINSFVFSPVSEETMTLFAMKLGDYILDLKERRSDLFINNYSINSIDYDASSNILTAEITLNNLEYQMTLGSQKYDENQAS